MKNVLTALARLAMAYLFYPVMIGLFLWVFFTGRHWGFGLVIIALILWLDPMWRILARSLFKR